MRMRAILATIMALAALGFAGAASAAPPTVLIDGVKLDSDVPPIEVGGRVLVPLRAIFERFGASVYYDVRSQAVAAELGNRVVSLVIGSRTAYVNGKPVPLDVPAQTFAGRTEVPLRLIGEALGAVVDYNAATDTVAVVTGRGEGNFVAAISGPRYAAGYASAATGTPPSITDQRPAPDSEVGTAYPEIYARLTGGTAAVDPASIRITLDGRDVTADATISAAYVSYTPSGRLYNGSHTVEISGRSDDGAPFDDQWSFQVNSGTSSEYVSSVLDEGYSSFGYPRFGFYPPGFALFVPGPRYFVFGNFIEIVFYSQFFPNGSCFVTITGFPGSYICNPWAGFPGYYMTWIPVPYGISVPRAIVTGHFQSFGGGPRVVVQSTAPFAVDGRHNSLPTQLRFVNLPTTMRHPTDPHDLIVVKHVMPVPTYGVGAHGTTTTTTPVYFHLPPATPQPQPNVGVPTQPIHVKTPATPPPSGGNGNANPPHHPHGNGNNPPHPSGGATATPSPQ